MPVLIRRSASSFPRWWGIETVIVSFMASSRGTDLRTLHVGAERCRGRAARARCEKFSGSVPATIWSEITAKENAGGAQRGKTAGNPNSMSTALREGVQRLEITTRVTLGVLALASGVYTYLGVRELLNGNATVVFFAAVIYSVAVSIGIYAFWTFLLRFLPHIRDYTSRSLLFGCMALGRVMIIAMSAWLNASALAGAAAIQQHLANSVQAYTRDLDRAHANAIAAQSLLPDIQLAATRFQEACRIRTRRFADGNVGVGNRRAVADANGDATERSRHSKSRSRAKKCKNCSMRAQNVSRKCASSHPRAVLSPPEAMLSAPKQWR